MKPDIDKSTGLNLPEPVSGRFEGAPAEGEAYDAVSYETLPVPEKEPSPTPSPPAADSVALPAMSQVSDTNMMTGADSVAVATSTSVNSNPDVSDEEIVSKAKEIIAETRDDPFRQTKEIASLKTELRGKKFNNFLENE